MTIAPLKQQFQISPGWYRMRNGQRAIIEKSEPCTVDTDPPRLFMVLVGRCYETGQRLAWAEDGMYGAVKEHAFDLVGAA